MLSTYQYIYSGEMSTIYQHIYIGMILLLINFRIAYGASFTDYKDPDCRYHFHFRSLSWMEAFNVCEGNNQTLLKLDTPDEHSKIDSIVKSKISSILSTSVETMWIGLHATSQDGSLHHFWPDCAPMTSTSGFNPWEDSTEAQKEGCVLLNPSSSRYSMESCNASLPFVCEDTVIGPVQCFFPMADTNTFDGYEYYSVDETSCAELCHKSFSSCAGVMRTNPCTVFTYDTSPSNTPGRGTFYANSMIDWNQYTGIASTIPPAKICSASPSSSFLVTVTSTATLHPSSESPSTSVSAIESSTQSLEPSLISQTLTMTSISSTPSLQTVSDSISSSPFMSTLSSSDCYCPCPAVNNVTYTPEELQKKIEQMKAELTVAKKQTNKYKRTLISIPDDRPSARGIGSLGIISLCAVVIILVAFDFPRAAHQTLRIARRAKEICREKHREEM